MAKLNQLTVSAINTGMNDITGRCKVAWDEWNMFGWVVPGVNDDTRYTLQNAIVTGLILNMFIRDSDTIGMANYSTFVNINGAVKVHGDQVVKRAQYATFKLMANHVGTKVLDVKMDSPTMVVPTLRHNPVGRPSLGLDLMSKELEPVHEATVSMLDCTATMDDNGTVYVSVINKSPDTDVDAELVLRGMNLHDRQVRTLMIYHDGVQAANTLDQPDRVVIQQGMPAEIVDGAIKTRIRKHSLNMIVIQ